MHEKLKHLIRISKELFSLDYIDKLSKNSGFTKRKGKLSAKDLLAFNIFSSEDMCTKSLSTLCARFEAQFGILMLPQSLNERFNDSSVKFIQEIFTNMLTKQNKLISTKLSVLPKVFNRILVTDSTVITLPREFYSEFRGSGNEYVGAAVKIQLQYDLLTGTFTCCEIQEGVTSDASYTKTMSNCISGNDLSLADLGYYKSDFLKQINGKKAFYISKIKNNTAIYIKNPNPEIYKTTGNIKKSTEFIKIDIYNYIEELEECQTIELNNVFIGSKKELKPRLTITKLSKEHTKQRSDRLKENVHKNHGSLNPRSISWNSLNAYITNVEDTILKTEEIHLFYSLRWQVELMFKIWKSLFKINRLKRVKIQRFKCFLYARLISILLSSSIVFTAKDIILEEENKEISNFKSFDKVIEYFPKLRQEIFYGEIAITRIFKRLILVIGKLGIKSKKKGSKSTKDILKLITSQSIPNVKNSSMHLYKYYN